MGDVTTYWVIPCCVYFCCISPQLFADVYCAILFFLNYMYIQRLLISISCVISPHTACGNWFKRYSHGSPTIHIARHLHRPYFSCVGLPKGVPLLSDFLKWLSFSPQYTISSGMALVMAISAHEFFIVLCLNWCWAWQYYSAG